MFLYIFIYIFIYIFLFCVVNKRIEQQKRTKAIRYILLSWKCVSTVASCNLQTENLWMSWTLILYFFVYMLHKNYINTVIMCTFYSPMFHSASPPSPPSKSLQLNTHIFFEYSSSINLFSSYYFIHRQFIYYFFLARSRKVLLILLSPIKKWAPNLYI